MSLSRFLPRTAVILGAAALVSTAGAASASAATYTAVSYSGGVLSVTAGAGATNAISVADAGGGSYRVKDLGAGAVLAGPFEQRRQDELGLAIAMARNGRPYRQQEAPRPTTAIERSIELSYLAQANNWFAVQPDLQYVIHPGTDPTVRNALVFTLRFELSTDL